MAKKIIAMFLMCIVVMGALQFGTANEEVDKYEAKFEAKYKSCYETCEKECLQNSNGQSFCEVKCDEDCDEKEVADKLHIGLR
ncbi:major pollen allergen Ole e 6-like [Benincasa hispida]|uniref:major pollen allergen Ole e 6-like n=1 Tax=Benincasa hispida TaxID=102211 RepID=UPI0019011919|nr:major pollen allergen Ole e 6-like [Benincasa hispida]